MNPSKYRWIIYFITSVMLATLAIQGYWNYKNYQIGKQQLINDVQTSLDNAVNNYFAQRAKGSMLNGVFADTLNINRDLGDGNILHVFDSINTKTTFKISINDSSQATSIFQSQAGDNVKVSIVDSSLSDNERRNIYQFIDSLSKPVTMLTSKILVSMVEDSVSLSKIDELLEAELSRKNVSVDYGLKWEGDLSDSESIRPDYIAKAELSTSVKSPFFFDHNHLSIHFGNITASVLKKNLLGIILSLLLVFGILASLLYLLKVIKQQKRLAEVKNDLINNITHEFKTPLATIGVAMEGIRQFNEGNDPEKNKRYTQIASEQVNKLTTMVEKLLETATLDSEKLQLNLETINLVQLLQKCTQNENLELNAKPIQFETSEELIEHAVDEFHFENAINNLIDNAQKYGGEDILVSIKKHNDNVSIKISDSGTGLSESDKKQIFEKFYRSPKGNTHDIKGYGIGLYYTRKIIEKHGGTIDVTTNGRTTFEITL